MPMLPLFKTVKSDEPFDEATSKTLRVGRVEVPWTNRVDTLVVVPMPTLPLAETLSKLIPVEVLTWKGLRVVVPWTNNEVVEFEAFTPATVPLSI